MSEPNLIKVSLLKAFKESTEKPELKVVGRHQLKKPIKKSKVTFHVGEGCAGMAYETDLCVAKSVKEFDGAAPDGYFEESQKVFQLNKKKAEKLNEKCCEFLCFPVHFFSEDRAWGILSIDSVKCGVIKDRLDARKIEDALYSFSPVLMV